MSQSFIVRKRAENHLKQAYDWYEAQRPALGDEFLLSVEAALFTISKDPMMFQVRHKNIRCALIPRFPYGIFYFIEKNKIVITAVFHLSRNPKLWKR